MTAWHGCCDFAVAVPSPFWMFIKVQPGWIFDLSRARTSATGIVAGKAPVVKVPSALAVPPLLFERALILYAVAACMPITSTRWSVTSLLSAISHS